jgi:hypothetical protein
MTKRLTPPDATPSNAQSKSQDDSGSRVDYRPACHPEENRARVSGKDQSRYPQEGGRDALRSSDYRRLVRAAVHRAVVRLTGARQALWDNEPSALARSCTSRVTSFPLKQNGANKSGR